MNMALFTVGKQDSLNQTEKYAINAGIVVVMGIPLLCMVQDVAMKERLTLGSDRDSISDQRNSAGSQPRNSYTTSRKNVTFRE